MIDPSSPLPLSLLKTLTHEGTGQNEQLETVTEEEEDGGGKEQSQEKPDTVTVETKGTDQSDEKEESHDGDEEGSKEEEKHDFVSSDVCFVSSRHKHVSSPVPYGLPCVRELLRFLVSIINSRDR